MENKNSKVVPLFSSRHIGPSEYETALMLSATGVSSFDELTGKSLPSDIRTTEPLALPAGISEAAYLDKLSAIAAKNKIYRSYIGMGYYGTHTPSVIKRNILENPSWYTSYTPYQAEISQGRLEALLNFQTMIVELTSMDIANASLLDEATAAAEAMMMLYNARSRDAVKAGVKRFFVDEKIFPQTLDVMFGRSKPLGIEIVTGDYQTLVSATGFFGAIVQYPDSDGDVRDYSAFADTLHSAGAKLAVIADLMSLALLTPPGKWGADVVVGSSQRFGIPMGYGGPSAAYFATRDEFKRNMPGRIIGVSVDAKGKRALRMSLQTREQHIKRERATSNICTAQALLATMAGMYAVYHGPLGLFDIAAKIHQNTLSIAKELIYMGFEIKNKRFFDTLTINVSENQAINIIQKAEAQMINLRYGDGFVGISLDETVTDDDVHDIIELFRDEQLPTKFIAFEFLTDFLRKDTYLKKPVFNSYHSETEMMRYIKKLERKDISLTHSMIPLGSCTMKLNSATSMFALSWAEFGNIHPFAPKEQAAGYHELFDELSHQLAVITGLDAVSLQPNSGAAGEYTGLMVIRAYHAEKGEGHRNTVLIPSSAHGTNPATAAVAGMDIVIVPCDERGNIDISKLEELAETNKEKLAALMITYPSTHGVFEEDVKKITSIIHRCGGQVYMDGANMNAQVGLTNPGFLGADVCHLNLHKTFGIPHGGGGPGVGPICVAKHLTPYLPDHKVVSCKQSAVSDEDELKTENRKLKTENRIHAVAAAPWGSASVLTISHAYITMMGSDGLTQATRMAILNANYLLAKLRPYFETLFTNTNGMVAHELILSCTAFKNTGITATDIAKRLMDYGFHAPTLSFPVVNTLMVEPTESEALQELDRFVEAMASIYSEIQEIASGVADATNNLLKNAPHAEQTVTASEWTYPYSREKAAYPLNWVRENKFWPASSRLDEAYGDRNLVCVNDWV